VHITVFSNRQCGNEGEAHSGIQHHRLHRRFRSGAPADSSQPGEPTIEALRVEPRTVTTPHRVSHVLPAPLSRSPAARRQNVGRVSRVVGVFDDNYEERMRQIDEFVRIDDDAEGQAWRPDADSIEALILKLLGSWEMLKSHVNWAYFNAAGPGGPPAESKQLPTTLRQVAESYDVRWPHAEWSAACAKANKVRQKLAHLLFVYKVDNESLPPDRKLAFMRLGVPGQRRTVDQRPAELEWGDSVWPNSQQTQHVDLITEKELIEALAVINGLWTAVSTWTASAPSVACLRGGRMTMCCPTGNVTSWRGGSMTGAIPKRRH
jgi:hypothetical protein